MKKYLTYTVVTAILFVPVYVLSLKLLELSRDASVFLSVCVAILGPFYIFYGWGIKENEYEESDEGVSE